MPDDPQREADVQLVIDAMAEACCHCPLGSCCSAHGMEAEAAIDALAKAHRLRMTPAELDALTLAAYEDGKGDGRAEGRRRAAEAIRANAADTNVIEGGPDLMAWAAEIAECPRCPLGLCSAHRSTGQVGDVAMSQTSRHGDNAPLKAICVGLANARHAGVHDRDDLCAALVAAVLDEYGLILPVGVTIGAVYEVFRDGDRDGYEFTDRHDADRQALYGGQDGTPGEVRAAWRIQADGVDVTTTWRPA